MKIIDLLRENTLSLSFEVFPPKTETCFDSVKAATEEIAKLYPSFMSVTYGAGGGTSKYTLDIAKNIKEIYNVPTLAHLTCVSSTKETVREKIMEIKEAGIENVMALRGDIPVHLADADRTAWDYQHAIDLVRELKNANPDFCIGGACYPEIHPESINQADDIKRLKEKVDAGCDFLTTQMFFDNALLYNFLYKIREAGIAVPVIPGVMPITNANQVARAIQLSGSFMPQRFKSLVDKFGSDPAAMKQAGIAYATDQIIDLYANGITNVHVYSMNKPDVAQKNSKQLVGYIRKMSTLIVTENFSPPPVCEKSVLRYAGCKEATPEICSLLQSCKDEAEGRLTYKVCYGEFPVHVWEGVCDFGEFSLTSRSLSSHLENCDSAVVFAATVGVEIDRLIVKYSKLSPAKALMFQAIGAQQIEVLCDRFCDKILQQKQKEHGENVKCQSRFSPGYGDLSLANQKTIFSFLDCGRKIGLTLTDSFLMSPTKSVTAIVGFYKDKTL